MFLSVSGEYTHHICRYWVLQELGETHNLPEEGCRGRCTHMEKEYDQNLNLSM